MKLITKTLFIFAVLFITGCYDELNQTGTPDVQKYITSADFQGADSATNIVTGIQIDWQAVSGGKSVIGYKIYRYSLGARTLLASLDPNTTTYIDGSVQSGSKYQYLVRAVDPSHDEDANEKLVSAIAWSGLTSVVSTENDSITVNFDSRLQGYHLQISMSDNQTAQTVVTTLVNSTQLSAGSYKITSWTAGSIKPGANYNVYAQIVDPATGINDGNILAYPVRTNSYGFDNNEPSNTPGWNSAATVRAFGRSPGTQQVTNLSSSFTTISAQLAFVPTTLAEVHLGFLPMSLPSGFLTSSYRYSVIRMEENDTVDTSLPTCPANTLGNCIPLCPVNFTTTATTTTPSSLDPCVVRYDDPAGAPISYDHINPKDIADGGAVENGLIKIMDNTVWEEQATPSTTKPPRYRYMFVLKHLDSANSATGYRESLPMTEINKFSILVPIPPNNMVLVNREAANYEFCTIQKGGRADPLNYNRCSNAEVGSRPLNSNPGNTDLNLAAGFYDFGYNLFVDRYPLACNPTQVAVFGGLNSDNNGSFVSSFDINSTAPAGSTNNVLYSANTTPSPDYTNCNYHDGTRWRQLREFDTVFSALQATVAYRTTLTNDPESTVAPFGKPKFTYLRWTPQAAMSACSSFSYAGYGPKRIPRLREFRAFTAPPFNVLIGSTRVRDFYVDEITEATTSSASTWKSGQCVLGNVSARLTTANGLAADVTGATNLVTHSFDGSALNYSNDRSVAHLGGMTPRFMIGSKHNAACMSRYGVADVLETPINNGRATLQNINTAWYPTSDLFAWLPTTTGGSVAGIMKGVASSLDSGNVDASYDIEGPQTGYRMTIATSSTFTTASTNKFDIALGLPVLSTQQGVNAYAENRTATQNYNFTNLAIYPVASANGFFGLAAARYSLSFGESASGTSVTYPSQVRCVLPAE